ncbi:MAG: Ni/Fe hydrogenase subunit alpha [Candidatus Micrarchaeota archaeon]
MVLIKLDHITKIEGHGSLHVQVEEGEVKEVQMGAVEGARFFEAVVKGREFHEIPTLTSPICGICSQAHVLASISAIECATGIEPSHQTVLMRELLNIGQYVQSHNVHTHFLVLPDYFGYGDAIAMMDKHEDVVKRALKFKRWASSFCTLVGGRDMHPVCAQVGGFSHIPDKGKLSDMISTLKELRPEAMKIAEIFGSLKYPDFERKKDYASLIQENKYPLISGDVTIGQTRFSPSEYLDNVSESTKAYSPSKYSLFKGKSFMVGSLARINNNLPNLSDNAKVAIAHSEITFPNNNPFTNNFAQAVEIVHCVDRAIDILENHRLKREQWIHPRKLKIQNGRGVGAVEAPRGTLYHDYTISKGIIQSANIITPTVQNLNCLEDDVRAYLPKILDSDEKTVVAELEKLVRAYDPCCSCSVHYLDVRR